MVVFVFSHLADAVAVRKYFVALIRISHPILTHIECDLTECLFDVYRLWLAVFSEEQENNWLVPCVTWWDSTSSVALLVCP